MHSTNALRRNNDESDNKPKATRSWKWKHILVVGGDQSWLKNEVIFMKYNNGINTDLWECITLLYSRCYNYKVDL